MLLDICVNPDDNGLAIVDEGGRDVAVGRREDGGFAGRGWARGIVEVDRDDELFTFDCGDEGHG